MSHPNVKIDGHRPRIGSGMPVCQGLLFGLLALSFSGSAMRAGESGGSRPEGMATPATPATPAALETPPRDILRDPFWPVDFVRPVQVQQVGEKVDPEAAAKVGEQEWRTMEKALHETVKGVSRLPTRNGTTDYLAFVNGALVGVGESVSLAANGKTYRWKVIRITLRDGPEFERMSSTRTTPGSKK